MRVVLARDRQALVDLVSSTLGPLEQARGGAVPLLDTLTAYFDSGCVAASTARRLSLGVRALTYRLARVHTLTGVDPTDPIDRYTLQTAVIGAGLLDWPTRPLSSTQPSAQPPGEGPPRHRTRWGSAIPTPWPVCVWRRVSRTSIVDTEGFE